MSRFVTKGRANPWQIPAPRRFMREGRTGPLIGMNEREPAFPAWSLWLCAAFAAPFVASFLGAAS